MEPSSFYNGNLLGYICPALPDFTGAILILQNIFYVFVECDKTISANVVLLLVGTTCPLFVFVIHSKHCLICNIELYVAECFKDRTDVQCLHRWQKVLNPELVKGPWSKEVYHTVVSVYVKPASSFFLLLSILKMNFHDDKFICPVCEM